MISSKYRLRHRPQAAPDKERWKNGSDGTGRIYARDFFPQAARRGLRGLQTLRTREDDEDKDEKTIGYCEPRRAGGPFLFSISYRTNRRITVEPSPLSQGPREQHRRSHVARASARDWSECVHRAGPCPLPPPTPVSRGPVGFDRAERSVSGPPYFT